MIDYSILVKRTNEEFTSLVRKRIELQESCRHIIYSTVKYNEQDIIVIYVVGLNNIVHAKWRCTFNVETQKYKCKTI